MRRYREAEARNLCDIARRRPRAKIIAAHIGVIGENLIDPKVVRREEPIHRPGRRRSPGDREDVRG